MKKLLPFLIIFLSYSISGQGGVPVKPERPPHKNQKPRRKPKCISTLGQSPILRGLKLGNTVNETAQLFGKTDEDSIFYQAKSSVDKPVKIVIDSEILKKTSRFYIVKSLTLEFYSGKLYKIDIRYSEDVVRFSDNRQFAQIISEKFGLKEKAWSYYQSLTSSVGTLKCTEFQVDVQYAFNEIILTDLTAVNAMENKEDQKRKIFEP